MKKLIQTIFVLCLMFSFVGCSSKTEDTSSDKEEKTTETSKTDKKDKKESEEKTNTTKEKEQTKETQNEDVEVYEDTTYYEDEPVQETQEQDSAQTTEETVNYNYVPEEDMIFTSYDEALSYGKEHAWEMHDKYGKAVQYGATRNSDGQIVLSWYVAE